MTELGSGLYLAKHYEDALSVQEAELSMLRRLGAPEENVLITQGNIGNSYQLFGRLEEALGVRQDVYSGTLKFKGEEHHETFREASNYAYSFVNLRRFEEAKSLLSKTMPVAQRVLGESDITTLRLRWNYASSLYQDDSATLDDLREAVTTLEDTERTARRVLGSDHPFTATVETSVRNARAALVARDGDDASAVCEALRKAEV